MLYLTGAASTNLTLNYPVDDNFTTSTALGSVIGTDLWSLEGNPRIPEIDIKVDSVAVTAVTK